MAQIKQRHLIGGVCFGAAVYAAMALWGDVPALSEALSGFDLRCGVWALVAVLLGYGLRFVKWQLALHVVEVKAPVALSATVFLAGMVMSITPGKVGEVLKSALLKRELGVSMARTAPVVVLERLTDLIGVCVIAAWGARTFERGAIAAWVTVAAVALGVVALSRQEAVRSVLRLMERWGWTSRAVPALREAYGSMRALLGWRTLAATTLLSVGAWGLEGVAFWWVIQGFGGSAQVWFEAMFIFALTTLLGAVSFLPGGVGVTEGGMVGLLGALHVFEQSAVALAATYVVRGATLWFGVALGGAAWGALALGAARRARAPFEEGA